MHAVCLSDRSKDFVQITLYVAKNPLFHVLFVTVQKLGKCCKAPFRFCVKHMPGSQCHGRKKNSHIINFSI